MPLSSTSLSEETGNKKVDYNSPQVSCDYSWMPLTEFVLEPVLRMRPLNINENLLWALSKPVFTRFSPETPCVLNGLRSFLYKNPRAHSESSCWVQIQLVLLCAFLGMQTRWVRP